MIRTSTHTTAALLEPAISNAVATTSWRTALPVLEAGGVRLRELRLSDAPSLLAMLNAEEVSRFVSPPPTSVAGFERFIAWTHRERAAGRFVCFGVVPEGHDEAIGIIQVRALDPAFAVAEWGFAIGSSFWGRGVFPAAARAVLAFTFGTVEAHRLEARSSVENGRGSGALQKIGAVREGVLRRSFLRNNVYHDQVIWSICADDWRQWQCAPAGMTSH